MRLRKDAYWGRANIGSVENSRRAAETRRGGPIPSMDTPRSSQRGSEFWSFLGFLCRRVLGLSSEPIVGRSPSAQRGTSGAHGDRRSVETNEPTGLLLVRSEGSGPAADGPLAASTVTTPRERSAGSQPVFCRLFACQRGSDTPGADRADAAGGCIQRGAPFGLSPSATSRRGVAASSSRSPRYRRAGGTSSRDLAEVSPLLFGLIGHSDRYLTALGEVHIEPDSTNGS